MKKIFLKLFSGIAILLFLNSFGQTTGTLTFTFTTPKHSTGNYTTDGRYVLALWIETSTGTFVKTKLRYVGGGTDDHLVTWGTAAGCADSSAVLSTTGCNTTDATTGATQTTFVSRTVTWDGKNTNGTLNGSVVADGTYRVAIEETWGHGSSKTTRYFTFTKGAAIDNQTPTADTNFTAISLKWIPTALATTEINVKPKLNIVPNPSKGLISLSMENKPNYISVFTMDGKQVYQEKIIGEISTKNKEINLTFLENGQYIVSLSNAYGTTNSKLIIAK